LQQSHIQISGGDGRPLGPAPCNRCPVPQSRAGFWHHRPAVAV